LRVFISQGGCSGFQYGMGVNLPGASEGKLFNFISRACPPDSSRGDSKEKANRGLTQPYAGLAGPFPPASSSGVPWLFPMDKKVQENDHPFEFDNVGVVIDPVSMNYLFGATIDYDDDLMGGGFRIENPNAISSCGYRNTFRNENNGEAPATGSCC